MFYPTLEPKFGMETEHKKIELVGRREIRAEFPGLGRDAILKLLKTLGAQTLGNRLVTTRAKLEEFFEQKASK